MKNFTPYPQIKTPFDVQELLKKFVFHDKHQQYEHNFYKRIISPNFRNFFIPDHEFIVDFNNIDTLYGIHFSSSRGELVVKLEGSLYVVARAEKVFHGIFGSIFACYEADIFSTILHYIHLECCPSSKLSEEIRGMERRSCCYPFVSNRPFPFVMNTYTEYRNETIRNILLEVELYFTEDYYAELFQSSDEEEED